MDDGYDDYSDDDGNPLVIYQGVLRCGDTVHFGAPYVEADGLAAVEWRNDSVAGWFRGGLLLLKSEVRVLAEIGTDPFPDEVRVTVTTHGVEVEQRRWVHCSYTKWGTPDE